MSHFTVTVITTEEPTDEVLSRTLQPFHEYECTGDDDEYVVDVDVTDEIKKAYEKYGNNQPLAEFASDWNGASAGDGGRFYRHTNPNAKWDWWQRGGRWQGSLLAKPSSATRVGTHSLLSKLKEPARPGGVDSVQVKNLDLAAMEEDAAKKAAKEYDAAQKIFQDHPDLEEFRIREGEDPDRVRAEYWAQAGARVWAEEMGPFELMSSYRIPREVFLQRARDKCLRTFAVLKDGKWYERGEMGWWGIVANGMKEEDWDAEFTKLVRGLPPEAWITVVDCHI